MMNALDILESKTFQNVFEALESDLWEEFQVVDSENVQALKGLSLKLWGLRSVKNELERRLTKSVETRIN